jgi:hypothetical protein
LILAAANRRDFEADVGSASIPKHALAGFASNMYAGAANGEPGQLLVWFGIE